MIHLVRQLERQRANYDQDRLPDVKKESNTSESEMSDNDDEQQTVEIQRISPQQQTIVTRKPVANGRKPKTLPTNNSRLSY